MSAKPLDHPFEILLAEDSPGDARLTQEALRRAAFPSHLTIVPNGEEALALLRREPPYAHATRPDLVLLDLNMPRMDGRELLAVIKSDEALCDIPVVILTTSNAPQDVGQASTLHADRFITKPVDVTEFFRVIRVIEEFFPGTARQPVL